MKGILLLAALFIASIALAQDKPVTISKEKVQTRINLVRKQMSDREQQVLQNDAEWRELYGILRGLQTAISDTTLAPTDSTKVLPKPKDKQ